MFWKKSLKNWQTTYSNNYHQHEHHYTGKYIPMKTLVIYDSIFGNTEQIALTIGKALQSRGDIKVLKVNQVKPVQLTGLNLVIVGSPTRAFRPTGAITKFLG